MKEERKGINSWLGQLGGIIEIANMYISCSRETHFGQRYILRVTESAW